MRMKFLFVVSAVLLGHIATATKSTVEVQPRLDVELKPFVTSEERIRSHGYPAESHYVEDADGFVLHLFRLPYSPKLQNQKAYRPAILLQHGLLSNSDCWLSSGPDNSLAYNLVDAGYDVWLGNARGNIYSKSNKKMSEDDSDFWHFSWHEIGVVDIAAMIDYILETTGQKSLHYAGHSQGTTVYFVLMSERPEYNEKIKSAHMLAPCAFFEHGKSGVFELLAPLVGTPNGLWYRMLSDIEFIPKNSLINRLFDTACDIQQNDEYICKNLYLQVMGEGSQNTNMSSLRVLIETHPGGGSSNQGIHYIQSYVSHEFRQYDFGTRQNKKLYDQENPPDYDLNKITAPTYLYSSANDALCVPEDVNMLVSKLTHLKDDYRLPEPTWNHLDFIVANDIKTVINDRVIRICNEYENSS